MGGGSTMLIQRDGVTLEYDDPETLVIDGLDRCIKCERVLVGEEKGTCAKCTAAEEDEADEMRQRLEDIEAEVENLNQEIDELLLERDEIEIELARIERKKGGH
jgi:peptidoglycan hydrolase CwlO-like protein